MKLSREAFCYIWINQQTGRMYAGSHKGSVDDGYICSQDEDRDFFKDFSSGKFTFVRHILAFGRDKAMRVYEDKFLRSIPKENRKTRWYNVKFYARDYEWDDKMREGARQRATGNTNRRGKKSSFESVEKMRASKTGVKHTAQSKKNMRENSGRNKSWKLIDNLGEAHTLIGWELSDYCETTFGEKWKSAKGKLTGRGHYGKRLGNGVWYCEEIVKC